MVTKVNSFKQSGKEKKKQIHELEANIKKMEMELRALSVSSLLSFVNNFVLVCFRSL